MKFNWFLKQIELREPVSDLTWDSRLFVVHVINNLDVGGAEHFLVQLMRAQIALGCRVGVVTLTEPNPLAHDIYGSGILYRGCARQRLNDPRLLFDLLAVLPRLHPDVVHTHLFYADTFGRVAARLAGIRAVVSTEHSTEGWALSARRRAAMRWTTRLCQRLVAVSEAVRQSTAARLRLPAADIAVIPNGIDATPFAQARPLPRTDLGLGAGDFVIGCVGRMVASKGYDTLLRAVARLDGPLAGKGEEGKKGAVAATAVHVLMIGDGPERRALRELAMRLGLEARVRWLGFRTDVPRLLKTLDVFALPSTYEGHSIALLEAMAAGCACLVSDIPESVETVGEAAVRVPPRDEGALAAALQELQQDPARRARLGAAAQRAVQRFSIAAAAQSYVSVYEEILGRKEAAPQPSHAPRAYD